MTDRQWTAVLRRDRSQDGRFVYAVTSTGVFCRPSCPSRRPRRERVRVFASPVEATAAGFRPCRRCDPTETADRWTLKIARACETIALADRTPSLARLARQAGSTPHHFLRRFKAALGVSPREFKAARRLDAVKRRLRSGADVTTALFDAGYGSVSRFYEAAAPRLAMSPSSYRAGGAGEVVSYRSVPSSLGRVIVAATERGICTVAFGDTEAALLAELQQEYPAADLRRATPALAGWVDEVVRRLDGDPPQADLPIDVRATAFQRQVWDALRQIPRGETRTYGEVAAVIGRPAASRAVAGACAANRVAVLVPCHRVVPAAGGAGGYRWGPDRKRALLDRERRRRGSSV